MSSLKISKHSDVPAALDLVREEVEKESRRIFSVGGDALKTGNIKPAKEAIAYAEKLADFVKKIQKIGEEWEKLEARIDAAAPEVREIVLPTKTRNHKAGYKINAGKKSPKKTFSVTFPDGTVISENRAKVVFGKAISKLGTSRVATFGIMLGGEPLLSRDKSVFKKNPGQVHPIGDGWYVKTHCSTAAKIELLKKIAAKMDVRIKAFDKEWKMGGNNVADAVQAHKEIVRKANMMRSSQAARVLQEFPYAVGKVVQAVFPVLQFDKRMTEACVAMLMDPSSSAHFKTHGWPVLKAYTGSVSDAKDVHGHPRYYAKMPLAFFGKKFWLTSQFLPHAISPVLAWFDEIGLKKEEVLSICQKRWGRK